MHFLFAWRYFKAKKSTNAINVISWISIGAIIIGTVSLILVLSVFNGLEGLVKSLYSTIYTDVQVTPAGDKTFMLTEDQFKKISALNGVRNISKVVEEKALVQNGDLSQTIIHLKGVDENYRYVTGIADHLTGNYDLGDEETPKMIVGVGVEGALGIQADRNISILTIYLPRTASSEQLSLENFTSDSIRTSASFAIQQEFDNKYGITNIDFIKKAAAMEPDEYTSLEIAATNPDDVSRLKKDIQSILGKNFVIRNKYEQNQQLYSVMTMERWVIYGVLCLILVIAAFNMIGALTMLVLEKKKDISVLHALGADRGFIQKIFLSEGIMLALIGAGTGMILALIIAYLQINYHLVPMSEGSFLIEYFPIKLRLIDFLLVGATVFVIAVIASLIPSSKASRQEFSLRSE